MSNFPVNARIEYENTLFLFHRTTSFTSVFKQLLLTEVAYAALRAKTFNSAILPSSDDYENWRLADLSKPSVSIASILRNVSSVVKLHWLMRRVAHLWGHWVTYRKECCCCRQYWQIVKADWSPPPVRQNRHCYRWAHDLYYPYQWDFAEISWLSVDGILLLLVTLQPCPLACCCCTRQVALLNLSGCGFRVASAYRSSSF